MQLADQDGSLHVLEYHQRYRNEELIKYMPYRPGLHVLACGRGMGVLLDQLAGRTAAAWGADRTLPVEMARLDADQVTVAALEAVPFAGQSFDVVVGEQVLAAAADPVCTLSELGRVLCPGGCLILWESRGGFEGSETRVRHWLRAAGLTFHAAEPYDYLAYPAALAMSRLPGLAYSGLAQALSKATYAVDNLLGRWAWARHTSWHLIVVASKGESRHG
jgi:ubiquinone/menaquinone biosynthesis C-methylase UbiE